MFAIGGDADGYYEPGAGYLRPEAAVAAQLELAAAAGATLRLGERVSRWEACGSGVSVTTAEASYTADRLVLCAGPWLPSLFPEGRELFAVYRQLLYWFEIERGYDQLREMPIFFWDLGPERSGFVHRQGFYGLPAIDGPDGGVKVGSESYEQTTAADGRQHPATATEVAEMYEEVGPRLPWLGPSAVRTRSCLYTNTRGGRFVIDRHPEHEQVVIVSPCSGHGFKHAPAIGEAVAQLLTTGSSDLGLEPFRLDAVRGGIM
jgi:sarcosine oxidase